MNYILHIQNEAYRRYQFNWCMSHGWWLEEIADEICFIFRNEHDSAETFKRFEQEGLGGEIYAGYKEFCDNIFLDAKYMYRLLDQDTAEMYELHRVLLWLPSQDKHLNNEGAYITGINVPHNLLKPNHICWNWPETTKKEQLVKDLTDRLNVLIKKLNKGRRLKIELAA